MTLTGGFDAIWQFRPEVVADVVTRQLADPLTTTPEANTYIRRFVTTRVVPGVVAAALTWGAPTVGDLDGERMVESVPLSGGVRPPLINRNLALSAIAKIPVRAFVTRDAQGAPYVAAQITSAEELTLDGVKVGLGSVNVPVPFAKLDISREIAPLRPLILETLLVPIARLAHSYTLATVPARFGAGTADALPLAGAAVRSVGDAQTAALTLGVAFGDGAGKLGGVPSAFADGANVNAALALSGAGLNRLLDFRRGQGRLRGAWRDPRTGQTIAWQWDALRIDPGARGTLRVAGTLNGNAAQATVTVALNDQQDLRLAAGADVPALVSAAIAGALFAALSVDGHDDGRLWQRLLIPGTRIAVEAHAADLGVDDEGLRLRYAVPLHRDPLSLHRPQRTPVVTVAQATPLPAQATRGAPVTATVLARLTSESFPPYDFVWQAGAIGTQGETFTLTAVPTGPGAGPVATLATARLQVTDLLSQQATIEAPVRYQPAGMRGGRGRGGRVALGAGLAGLLIVALLGTLVATGRVPLPIFGGNTAGATATATATATLPAIAASCATDPALHGAPAATGGASFPDFAFPGNSLGAGTTPPAAIYTYHNVSACTDQTTPAALSAYFARSLAAKGWQPSTRFPAGGDPLAACPAGAACWLGPTPVTTVAGIPVVHRYAAIAGIAAYGAATTYQVSFAVSPPVRPFTITARANKGLVAPGQAATVQAACAAGETAVGGGETLTGGAATVLASLPTNGGWSAQIADNDAKARIAITVTAECLQASFPFTPEISMPAAENDNPGQSLTQTATCPGDDALLGGGYQLTPSGPAPTIETVSADTPTATGWNVVVQSQADNTAAILVQLYAVCAPPVAVATLVAGQPVPLAATAPPAAITACPAGTLAIAGGFAIAPTPATPTVNAATTPDDGWQVTVPATAAGTLTANALCLAPDPQF